MTSQGTTSFRVGLALSGGGFRAASFHLGVLKRLEELGVLGRVTVMSSVSGGAIVGALYALRCATRGDGKPGSFPVSNLIEEMRPRLTGNLRGRALFGRPHYALRTLASFVSARARRMPLVAMGLDRAFYGDARLAQLPDWIVINATNLRTGKAWKFFKDRAGDFLTGATDRTDQILVAEAVGASAAYPVLVDPYPFRTRWEDLRADLLDSDRWQRPAGRGPYDFSRWRRRFGRPTGAVTFPLVDGGVYDNEGLNGLRGAGVTHAILSNASPAEGDFTARGALPTLRQTVEVMHSRLGATTRQLAHEMAHGVHPSVARGVARKVADALTEMSRHHSELAERLAGLAQQIEPIAPVGWPPRGHQFVAVSQVLLHSTGIARNESAAYTEDPFSVPAEDRGLDERLVEEIARVRTDLDALEPDVFDLLVAQGYFVTDAYLKIGMPEVVRECSRGLDPRGAELRPTWTWAHEVIGRANAHPEATATTLRKAALRRGFHGRCESRRLRLQLIASTAVALGTILTAAGLLAGLLWWSGRRFLMFLSGTVAILP